jgi:hypothetical protein
MHKVSDVYENSFFFWGGGGNFDWIFFPSKFRFQILLDSVINVQRERNAALTKEKNET